MLHSFLVVSLCIYKIPLMMSKIRIVGIAVHVCRATVSYHFEQLSRLSVTLFTTLQYQCLCKTFYGGYHTFDVFIPLFL